MVSKVFDSDEQRWAAVQSRDPAARDAFCYAVKTTGVFCRPTCASRVAHRENVAFFGTAAEAYNAGFRPCKRCRPSDPSFFDADAALITRICREFESSAAIPKLEILAEAAQLSPFHFHRLFKSIMGITPRAYFAGRRSGRMQKELKRSPKITDAVYEAGFNSSGRFYASTTATLGMTPSAFRSGGTGESIRFAVGECSLGPILIAGTERGICAILIGSDPGELVRDLQDRFSHANIIGADKQFEDWVSKVVGFVERPVQPFSLPLDLKGTAFQQRVWQALREIPCGSTVSYREIARRIGAPKSSRAVAAACAANPVAVAVPCHRIVRQDGSVSGYRWGVDRKESLLAREADLAKAGSG